MKISDITTLLGKGYSVEQIKAVAEDEKKNSDVVQVALASESYEKYNELLPVVADIVTTNDQEQTPEQTPDQETKPAEDMPEYKKLYEEAKAKLEKFKQDQAKAMARENIAGDPVDVDTVINSITDSIL